MKRGWLTAGVAPIHLKEKGRVMTTNNSHQLSSMPWGSLAVRVAVHGFGNPMAVLLVMSLSCMGVAAYHNLSQSLNIDTRPLQVLKL